NHKMTTHLNRCTYEVTGNKYEMQYFAHCLDCFPKSNEGACLTCLQLCHAGHKVGPLKQGPFFCDCGISNKCKISKNFKPLDKDDPMDLDGKSWDQGDPMCYDGKTPNVIQPNCKSEFMACNHLSEKLFNVMDQDRIFSPMSIAYALALVHFGALGNTDKEITNLFAKKHSLED